MRKAADWSDLLGDIHLCRSSRTPDPRTTEPFVKRSGASSWCRGVAAWERGAKARLVSVAARHGAFEALLLMIMVFYRLLLLCIPCKEMRGRKRGARQDCDASLAKVETWFRFSIPSSLFLSLSGFFVLPFSLYLSLALSRVPVPRVRRCRRFSVSPLSVARQRPGAK